MVTASKGQYYEFHIPLGLKELIEDAGSTTTVVEPAQREWFSQPRMSSDPTIEVVQVNFKLPLSVSHVAFEAIRVSCRIEVWYQDRQNNWRQCLDQNRIPVGIALSTTDAGSWYKFQSSVYPIVAKAMQFRLQRVKDNALGTSFYSVGLRQTLIRRNVYDRTDGVQALETDQDALGNVIAKYIKDWDAAKAIDDKPATFWRSQPMPDPQAVCSLYLDLRTAQGDPQLIDKVYIDPVHTNQTLNLYYSNDDTVVTRKLSPISLPPEADENTSWQAGRGRWDVAANPPVPTGVYGEPGYDPGTSNYKVPVAWGPLVDEDCWIGIEWTPDFTSDNPPALNPVLFEVVPTNTSGSQYWPTIYYDGAAGEMKLKLTNGTDVQEYSAAVYPMFDANQPLRIVVGWRYSPAKTVFISVMTREGYELANLSGVTYSELPSYITLDGEVGFSCFRGSFTAHVVSLEDYSGQYAAFQANPTVYVSPDPVVPDANGKIPSTTLDNSILACDWTSQEFFTGGSHETHFEAKEWTPIWKNYLTFKGNLALPQQISMKYLKMEFTNLTEEPYPVYDSGIQVSYKVFPISVIQLAIQQGNSQYRKETDTLTAGLRGYGITNSVNWMNPSTIVKAVNSTYGQTVLPVQVNVGAGVVTDTIPYVAQTAIDNNWRSEQSNPYIYRRQVLNVTEMTRNAYNMIVGTQKVQGLPSTVDELWSDVKASTNGTKSAGSTVSAALPIQGQDWWVFPGATLKMPASVMKGLTGSQTKVGRKPTLETRIRFATTSVHRYDIKTVRRDAAVAYFAGVREVQPLVTSYVAEQDPVVFSFSTYDKSQWAISEKMKKRSTGPLSAARARYKILNPGFDEGIEWWDRDTGNWYHDNDPLVGHWLPGTLATVADGTNQNITSTEVEVQEGWDFSASVWVRWADLSANSGAAVQLNVSTYLNGEIVGNDTVAEVTYSDWTGHEASTWTELTGSYTVPSGVDGIKVRLTVTENATAGTVHFDTVTVWTEDNIIGTIYKDFITTSKFARVRCEFMDSGVKMSDSMWAQLDPLDTNISHTALAYYTRTIPDVVPAGTWSDTFHEWGAATPESTRPRNEIGWGAPRSLVAIDVDPNRMYDGKRVLHFFRQGRTAELEAGEAGVKVMQTTNFVAGGLFRIRATYLKPYANNNQITVRLRRMSDGVFIYEETIAKPVVGYWESFKTNFQEIPLSADQTYTVELVCTGDDQDELYLSDLYCEVAHIRYYMQLGGEGFLHDVTELRYGTGAQVTCTDPVNEVAVSAVCLTDRAFLYGCRLIPDYLQ